MGKHIARLSMLCVTAAIVFASSAGAYTVPKPSGGNGSSKGPTKAVAKQLQNKTGGKLAASGIRLKVHFPKAGRISCGVTGGGGQIGAGTRTAKKRTFKFLKIVFTSTGKTFLKTGAGKTVTVTCDFKPVTGKSSHSSVTVKLG